MFWAEKRATGLKKRKSEVLEKKKGDAEAERKAPKLKRKRGAEVEKGR